MVSHDQVDCVYFTSLYNMYTCNFHSFRDTVFKIPQVSCLSNRICKDSVESILVCSMQRQEEATKDIQFAKNSDTLEIS